MHIFKLNINGLNLTNEREFSKQKYYNKSSTVIESTSTFIAHDQVYNDLRQEPVRFASKLILTFDRLRVSASDFIEMVASDGNTKVKIDLNLLNTSLPINVHLLTLQPWSGGNNEVLIRLENWLVWLYYYIILYYKHQDIIQLSQKSIMQCRGIRLRTL